MRTNPHPDDHRGLDRRTVLRGVAATGALGASLPLLASCGGGSGGEASGGSGSGSGSSPAAGETLGSAAEIPVGGGTVYPDQKVVVTQPTKGDYKAFSATCTHQGCTVRDVAGGTINCPCHGSKFNLDGTVANGPAEKPLPSKRIKMQGNTIRLA